MKEEKIKFIRTGIYFTILLLISTGILMFIPTWIFLNSGEYLSVDEVVDLRLYNNPSFLYGPAYSDSNQLFKLNYVNSTKCDVLVLGTSRVMQFRQTFFESSFCNAGGGVGKINEFKPFLESLSPERKPQVLIVGLDQYFFNPAWDSGATNNWHNNLREENHIILLLNNVFNIYKDLYLNKIDVQQIAHKKGLKIGLNAITNNNGFRDDGSYFYGQIIALGGVHNPVHEDYNFTNTFNRIDTGSSRFQYGDKLSEYSLGELDQLLNYCKENHIVVIGFLPPFAKEVWTELSSRQRDYGYLFKIDDQVRPIFEKYGYSYHDFSNFDSFGASSCEVIDGFHASEKAYLRILVKMGENDNTLSNYINLKKLGKNIQSSNNCFTT